MEIQDMTNAAFEGLAAVAILNHCRAAIKEKLVAGFSLLSIVFFTAWGF